MSVPKEIRQFAKGITFLPERWTDILDRLRKERVVGQSGAGLVTVEMNGLGEVLRVHLDPLLWEKADRETTETLLPAAINDARCKARQRLTQGWRELVEELGLPMDEFLDSLLPLC
jgi:hypothetical protein